jgi:hypothetical protein
MLPLGRPLPLRLGRELARLLGRGLLLPPCRRVDLSLNYGVVLAAIGRLGVHITREDNRVKAQSGRERCDPSKGGDDILAASQHQAAVDAPASSGRAASPRSYRALNSSWC